MLPVLVPVVLVVASVVPAVAAGAPGVWPLQPQPQVARGFDPPAVRWGSGHRGVDLNGRVGQPVHAALGGEVTYAGRIAGRGVVVVDHGATRTTYQPVTPTVTRGAVVARGEVIGALAWFGSHCMPQACLHWGLIAGSTYLDPLSLVGGGPQPVRLLPLGATHPGSSWAPAPLSSPLVPTSRRSDAAHTSVGVLTGSRAGVEAGSG